jgi:4-cresol dehydrogenase (hydroxylating) flavoprotein subunit
MVDSHLSGINGKKFGLRRCSSTGRGSVLLDLGKRMNMVLGLNEKTAVCLLEPGVS